MPGVKSVFCALRRTPSASTKRSTRCCASSGTAVIRSQAAHATFFTLCRFSKKRALPFPKRNVEGSPAFVDHMFKTLTLSIFFAAAAMAQQPPRFGEKVNVNLVLLDAVVTDSHGNQILGLDKDDFVVTENGAPQAIESLDYFTNRQLLTSPENKASFKAERVRDDRYFVFFFDKPNESAFFGRLAVARRAAADFIDKQMKPG